MPEKLNRIKKLYTDIKNGDSLMLYKKADVACNIHRKSSPDKPLFSLGFNCDDSAALIDIAIVGTAVIAVMSLCCLFCKLCRR